MMHGDEKRSVSVSAMRVEVECSGKKDESITVHHCIGIDRAYQYYRCVGRHVTTHNHPSLTRASRMHQQH